MAEHGNHDNLYEIGFSAGMPAVRKPHRQRDRRSNDPGYEIRVNEVIEGVMSGKYASWSDAHRQTGVSFI